MSVAISEFLKKIDSDILCEVTIYHIAARYSRELLTYSPSFKFAFALTRKPVP